MPPGSGEYPSGVAPAKQTSRGRVTPSRKQHQAAQRSGRYTAPIPREQRHSPPWFPYAIVGFLVIGLFLIIGNYIGIMPGGTSNWYLIGGIGGIIAGLIMATYYR